MYIYSIIVRYYYYTLDLPITVRDDYKTGLEN